MWSAAALPPLWVFAALRKAAAARQTVLKHASVWTAAIAIAAFRHRYDKAAIAITAVQISLARFSI